MILTFKTGVINLQIATQKCFDCRVGWVAITSFNKLKFSLKKRILPRGFVRCVDLTGDVIGEIRFMSYIRCPQLTGIEAEILLLPAPARGEEIGLFLKGIS